MEGEKMGTLNSGTLLFLFLSLFVCGGCKGHSVPYTVPPLTIKSDHPVIFRALSVYDRTNTDDNRPYSSFGIREVPIRLEPPFARIISSDLSAFIVRSIDSPYSLKVQIHHAEPYRTQTTLQKIPGLRFLWSGSPTEYGVYMQILFELEKDGKVIKTYTYDDTIRIVVQNDTGHEDATGHKKLVAAYRQEFFQRIGRDLIGEIF